jgi:hypothetical protein
MSQTVSGGYVEWRGRTDRYRDAIGAYASAFGFDSETAAGEAMALADAEVGAAVAQAIEEADGRTDALRVELATIRERLMRAEATIERVRELREEWVRTRGGLWTAAFVMELSKALDPDE